LSGVKFIGRRSNWGGLDLSKRLLLIYIDDMTALLDQTVDFVRQLPSDEQDEPARVLLQLAGHEQPPVTLTPAEAASFEESLRQADQGQFATDAEIRAIWTKHGL
jgi:hypothetical protein